MQSTCTESCLLLPYSIQCSFRAVFAGQWSRGAGFSSQHFCIQTGFDLQSSLSRLRRFTMGAFCLVDRLGLFHCVGVCVLAPILVGECHHSDHKNSAAMSAMQNTQSSNADRAASTLIILQKPLRGTLRRSSSLTHHCSPVRVPVQAPHHRAKKC